MCVRSQLLKLRQALEQTLKSRTKLREEPVARKALETGACTSANSGGGNSGRITTI